MQYLTSNKQFNFSADPDHDSEQRILMEILPLWGRANFKNSAVSAALVEVCAFVI